ncbi:MAG TPA: sugar ABC transporter permease [Opitutaceae bacterium]|nr:sugar ABC transporter permease [Opitutaceae bacterium]
MKPAVLRRHSPWAPWIFAAPFVLVFGTFVAWPLLQSLLLSFQQTYGPRHAVFIGGGNFRHLLDDPLFWTALRNTATYAGGFVFLMVPLSLGLALLLDRPGLRGRALFRLVFFAPSLVGMVFVAMIFFLLFQIRTGLIDSLLHALFPAFDPEFPWMQDYVMTSLIVASLWMYVGLNMVYFLAALQNVPTELLDAANMDGAGPWQRFRHVILPEIRPVAGFVVLLSVIGSFQLFELPWVMFDNSAGPNNHGLTVVMYLYKSGFIVGDLGYASAIGWLLALLLIVAAWVQRRLARAEEEAS